MWFLGTAYRRYWLDGSQRPYSSTYSSYGRGNGSFLQGLEGYRTLNRPSGASSGLFHPNNSLFCFSSLLLTQAKLHPEQLSEDEAVKGFAREGRLRIRQLKSIPD